MVYYILTVNNIEAYASIGFLSNVKDFGLVYLSLKKFIQIFALA